MVTMTTASGGGAAHIEGRNPDQQRHDRGDGAIGNSSLPVINGGTIDADSSAGTGILILNASGGITNANGATGGLLEATSGGTLQIKTSP